MFVCLQWCLSWERSSFNLRPCSSFFNKLVVAADGTWFGYCLNILTSRMKVDSKVKNLVLEYPKFGQVLEIYEIWKLQPSFFFFIPEGPGDPEKNKMFPCSHSWLQTKSKAWAYLKLSPLSTEVAVWSWASGLTVGLEFSIWKMGTIIPALTSSPVAKVNICENVLNINLIIISPVPTAMNSCACRAGAMETRKQAKCEWTADSCPSVSVLRIHWGMVRSGAN